MLPIARFRFAETIARFGEALSKSVGFRRARGGFIIRFGLPIVIRDYVQSALFRKYEGPLMEGIALRTMGKGLSKQQVLAGAMAEAVERISFFDGAGERAGDPYL